MSSSSHAIVIDDDGTQAAHEVDGHLWSLSEALQVQAGKTVFAVGDFFPTNVSVKIRWDQAIGDWRGDVVADDYDYLARTAAIITAEITRDAVSI